MINITLNLTDIITTAIQTILIVWIVKFTVKHIPDWMDAYYKKRMEKIAVDRALGRR